MRMRNGVQAQQDGGDEAQMQAMTAAMSPGEHHKNMEIVYTRNS